MILSLEFSIRLFQERGLNSAEVSSSRARKALIPLNTLFQEVSQIIFNELSLNKTFGCWSVVRRLCGETRVETVGNGPIWYDVITPEVFTCGRRRLNLDAILSTNQIPSLLQVLLWSAKLEVIDINNKEEFEFLMEVTGPPVLLCDLKTDRQEVLMAALLPVAAGIRMAVQTKDKRAHNGSS